MVAVASGLAALQSTTMTSFNREGDFGFWQYTRD
jgi:hypothetical protein